MLQQNAKIEAHWEGSVMGGNIGAKALLKVH
jgi:hypothetical protein